MKPVIIVSVVCACVVLAIKNKWRKEKEDMAVIYATLIIKGIRTIGSVPPTIREQVKQVLIDLEFPELAEENV